MNLIALVSEMIHSCV